jgi:hypothetical protein
LPGTNTNLLRKTVNYSSKKFYDTAPGSIVDKRMINKERNLTDSMYKNRKNKNKIKIK